MILLLLLLAEPAYALGSTGLGEGGGGIATLVPFILMFAVLYMLILRPQIKKQKDQKRMVEELKKGDRIVTNGGIHGVITNLKDEVLVVKIADNVKVEISRGAVSRVKNGGDKS